MNVPYKDRSDFFKYQSASICFDMVREISTFFLRVKSHRRDTLHDPLLVALHVIYARPFKQSATPRLDRAIVPAPFMPLHDKLITLRDKMYAHTDLDGPELADGICLNDLTGFTTNGRTTFGISVFNPSPAMHQAIVILADKLKTKTDELAQGIWTKYMRKGKVPDGVTSVNMEPKDGPLLITHPADSTQEYDDFYVDISDFKRSGRTTPHKSP